MSIGGQLSTPMRMNRYVEPQTRYSARKAPMSNQGMRREAGIGTLEIRLRVNSLGACLSEQKLQNG